MSSRILDRPGRNLVTYETLTYSVGSGLCRVTLNRPERRNGITNSMVREVHTAMATAAADASVRRVGSHRQRQSLLRRGRS